ncbi:energy transducer TonB [Pseudomonas cavernicola]|uniref:Energy transducer TonB n=1 Tax=Pseudomonas cavernicola TaxID=2320866 RepID=A0A418XDP4_9PSED|nr:energy transducer TonB [Pseudomonas cavernicola]RJG10453.1 energy transducer TonB [Pseudomonas cavernicola]
MIPELRRRAYLSAMQVANWLPRVALPFAAASRPELLTPLEPAREVLELEEVAPVAPAVAPATTIEHPLALERPKVEVPRPSAVPRVSVKPEVPDEAAPEPSPAKPVPQPPPRFALQLLRAGQCVLLVELPTGEPFTSRDPAYLLLKDLLRAAGLPDSPQLIGEPVRWPLLVRGNLDQGPQAALEYVQGFISARLEEESACACLWLVGLPAVRFAGEAGAEAYNRELQIDELGSAWALPGLELLMDEPARKAELWQAMRRVMRRWQQSQVESTNE